MEKLEARGIELAWEAAGEGPAVVLVHETATASSAWRPAADALVAAGASAILYDRRGWGASSAPDDYRRTTVEEQSEDLAELIAVATDGAGPVACGAGLGAVIALDLLVRRPELVAGAVLLEPLLPGLAPETTKLLSDDRDAISKAVNENGVEAVVELYLAGRLGGFGPGAERLPAELTQPARERPGSLVAELGAAAGWGMPLARLATAESPVSILSSADTPSALLAGADALGSRLESADSERLTAAGPPHLASPGSVAEAALALGG